MTESLFTPTLMLVEDKEWTARSIESILRPHRFAVIKAYTGGQCLQVIPRVTPDVVMVALHLPDMTGIELIGELRRRGDVRASTPLVMLGISEISQSERIDAFEAGVWDFVRPPYAPLELAHKLTTWSRAKRDADDAREEGLIDVTTGVYNFKGLVRRTEEIIADANRSENPVSFIVLAPLVSNAVKEEGGAEREQGSDLDIEGRMAKALRAACRLSDAVGRLGQTEFAIVAPQTDDRGASVLAKRVVDLFPDDGSGVQLRAGLYSARRSHKDPIESFDLLGRATTALRKAQSNAGGPSILTYETNN